MLGYVEAVQILDNKAPNYIGGGGMPADRLVEVEVHTSGDNGSLIFNFFPFTNEPNWFDKNSKGVLDMGAVREDTSFLIYTAARKGYYVARSFYSSKAIVHSPSGTREEVALRDDGLCTYRCPLSVVIT